MALGLTRWVGSALLLCGGLAAVLLPPEAEWFGFRVQRERSPEEIRERELSWELARAKELLLRRVWVERFEEALRGTQLSEPVFIALGSQGEGRVDRLEPWREAVEADLMRRSPPAGGTGLAFFFLPRVHDLPGGHRILRSVPQLEYYLLEGPTGAVCAVAILGPEGVLDSGRGGRAKNIVGPCGFYATHGMPGPGIRDWLEAGAYNLAQNLPDRATVEAGEATRNREIFGIRGFRYRWLGALGERCLTGRSGACGLWLTDPAASRELLGRRAADLAQRSELFHQQTRWWYDDSPSLSLLADLEATFGEERFRRFWRSPEPMPEAFRAAFGEAPATWTQRWAVARYGEEPAGPSLGFLTIVLSLLTLGATFLVGAYMADRRTVD